MVPKFVIKGGVALGVIALVAVLGHSQLSALYRDARIDANAKQLEKTSETVVTHGKTLDVHETTLQEHTRQIGEHDVTLKAHGGKLEAHGGKLEAHDTSLQESAHQREAQGKRISELEGFLEVTQGKLGGIERELGEVKKELEKSRAQQARQEQVQENILERLKTLEQNQPSAPE